MHNQPRSENIALTVLKEIQEKGFLRPDIFLQYRQKLSHAFATFLNQTPVSPKEAETCLFILNAVGYYNRAFFSLYQDTALELHDWASSGDESTRAQANVQLLRFFKFEAPASVKQKKELLGKIKNMHRLHEKHSLLADILYNISNHYEQNHQYNEDPNKECLSSVSEILSSVIKHKRFTSEEKVKFSYVADTIRSYVPKSYDEAWENTFIVKTPRKIYVPDIKEAVNIYSRRSFY